MPSLEVVFRNISSEFEAAQSQAAESARAMVTDQLNQIARRLQQYHLESDWIDAVLDGAGHFVSQIALFVFENNDFVLKGARDLTLSPDLRIQAGDANAFRSTLDTGETSVVLCTAGEISTALSAVVSTDRGFVVPISNGSRKVGLLFATAGGQTDANALELIAHLASAALERHAQTAGRIQIAPAPTRAEPVARNGTQYNNDLPPPTGLSEVDKLLHIRARRFARLKIAEMQLYRPEACQTGRARGEIYLFLKQEVETARETFRNQFMSTTGMIDYLHLELLTQLAENNESFLGADYPGQMA